MNMSRKIKIVVQIVVIVLFMISLGYYFYLDYQKGSENKEGETIDQIVNLNFIKQELSQEEINKYQETFDTQSKIFSEDPVSPKAFQSLIVIAQIKQFVEDYNGAKQALLWAIDLQPKSYLANGNLANLYFRYYEDFAKAEEYYLKVIELNDPQVIPYYYDLHEIYRYFYKQETTMAEDILKQGIEKYPKETNLMAVLAYYYKDTDRKNEAIEYYRKILEINPNSQVAKQGLNNL